MSAVSANGGLIAVISVEAFLFVCCVVALIIVVYGYVKRRKQTEPKSSLRPWPYVLPLYWYLSYYDSMVDRCFRVEPRLKMYQHIPNPPEKVKPLVKLFAELEKEIQSHLNLDAETADEIPDMMQTVDEEACYPERVAQLYELDEMVKHYQELEELYSILESGGAADKHVYAVCKGEEEGEDEASPDDVGEIWDIQSGIEMSGERDMKSHTESKGAVLLKEVKLSLDVLRTEEDTENHMMTVADNESDTPGCKTRCFKEHEDNKAINAKGKRTRRGEKRHSIRKKQHLPRKHRNRRKNRTDIVLL